jgi:hypothetical protein
MSETDHPLVRIVLERATPPAAKWFEEQVSEFTAERFAQAYAAAGRRLGDEPIGSSRAEESEHSALGPGEVVGWRLSDVGRCCLLMSLCAATAEERHSELISQHFYRGDNKEREALLKALVFLPEPGRFVDIAVDACRSHVQSVFEAIACENAYPAKYFPDGNFNQMVIKAFFTGVSVARIRGLEERRTPELARMASDYASERRAAGRSVPPDLSLVLPDEA